MRLFKMLLKRPRLWALHLSLIFIAAGAVTTWLTAKESTLVLRADHPVKRYGHTIELLQPDTLLIDGTKHFIAVNYPAEVVGCRLYQQSYLPEGVSVVSIRKDLPGTLLVYIGYWLFVVGGWIWFGSSVTSYMIAFAILSFASKWLAHSPLLQHVHWASMALVALAVVVLSLRYKDIRPYGLLAATCFAVVAVLQALHTSSGPMMPALQSPRLALHVGIVMVAYALFIVIAIMALKGQTPRRLLAVAVWLLGIGIATGSQWANESWGRYWSWDPKETLALITFLLYAIPLHLRHTRPWHYLAPLPALALTWFGITLFNSLHTY